MWEEFKPRLNVFPHIDGEVLDGEVVIIHSTGSAGESEVLEPYTRVHLPSVLGDVGGRSEALWKQRSLDLSAKGPWSRAIRAETPVVRPVTAPGARFTTPRDGPAGVCVACPHCRSMDVIIVLGPTPVADDAASVLDQPEPLTHRSPVRSGHQVRPWCSYGLLFCAR